MHVPLVHEDPAREPATADDPEDAVTGREPARSRPAGDHGSGHLDAGNVGRRAGWGGVAALALREVGRIQRRVADGDEDVVAGRDRIGPIVEPDDLVAAGTGEDDCSHALRSRMRTASAARSEAPSVRLRHFVRGLRDPVARAHTPGGPRCSQLSVPESRPTTPSRAWRSARSPSRRRPTGWEIIEVRAAALNHHDLWSLRGVGVTEDGLPVVLGTDAAGVTADGREVVVHAVLGSAATG